MHTLGDMFLARWVDSSFFDVWSLFIGVMSAFIGMLVWRRPGANFGVFIYVRHMVINSRLTKKCTFYFFGAASGTRPETAAGYHWCGC